MNHSDWNTVGLLLASMISLYTAFISRRTEKNTNSMKDALVKLTGEEAFRRGLKQGRDETKV